MRPCLLNLGVVLISFCSFTQAHAHGVAPHRLAPKSTIVRAAEARPKPEKAEPKPAASREDICRALATKYSNAKRYIDNGMAESGKQILGDIVGEALPPPRKGKVSDLIDLLATSVEGYRVVYLRDLAQNDCPQLKVDAATSPPDSRDGP